MVRNSEEHGDSNLWVPTQISNSKLDNGEPEFIAPNTIIPSVTQVLNSQEDRLVVNPMESNDVG